VADEARQKRSEQRAMRANVKQCARRRAPAVPDKASRKRGEQQAMRADVQQGADCEPDRSEARSDCELDRSEARRRREAPLVADEATRRCNEERQVFPPVAEIENLSFSSETSEESIGFFRDD